jgi:hypothetical protein
VKAYYLSVKDDDDAGQAVVFANTAKEAKKQVFSHDLLVDALEGGWINLRVNRAKEYDGMENLSAAELALKQWRNGWRFFDVDYPDPDAATDKEFLEWYEGNF